MGFDAFSLAVSHYKLPPVSKAKFAKNANKFK